MPDAWSFASSGGSTTYEVLRQPDGSLTCNCPGWTFKRKGDVRGCKHTKAVEAGSALRSTPLWSEEKKVKPAQTGTVTVGPTPKTSATDLDRAMMMTPPQKTKSTKGRQFTDD